MLNQSFILKNFKRLKKLGDLNKYFPRDDKSEIINKLKKVEEYCQNLKEFNFPILDIFSLNQNNVYKFSNESYIADFVLRKVNHNLKRIYNVVPANRNDIIKQVILLLREKYPFYIYKLDIKEFYENINVSVLLDKIEKSRIVSALTKFFLRKFFVSNNFTFLPRGINISSTLSEIYMADFDKRIKKLDGVYYYARFVDDMIIFSTKQLDIKEIIKKLPNLELNTKKTREINTFDEKIMEFEYLGYKIHREEKKSMIVLNIGIAYKKVKKIKNKIFLAFYDYNKNKKFSLLKKRILYLATSFPLKDRQQRLFNIVKTGTLHGGIQHSYPLIDEDCDELKQLDDFKQKIIFGKNYATKMSVNQKKELARISFVQSFRRKIKRNFSHKDMRIITRCWING